MKDQEKTKQQLIQELEQLRRQIAAQEESETERIRAEEAVLAEQRTLRQMLQVHERYRKLVAYEIHDGLVQSLTGALMDLEGSLRAVRDQCPDLVAQSCQNAFELLRQGIQEARRLMSGLGPPILDEFGIIAAVDHLVCELRRQSGPEIEYSHNVQFDRLASPLETAVFRIVQECLTNAKRHSNSDRVRVGLSQHGDLLRIEVQDWGSGFDLERVDQDRFGLEGIRERARLFGGRATIDSAPGKGTLIIVELPLSGLLDTQISSVR